MNQNTILTIHDSFPIAHNLRKFAQTISTSEVEPHCTKLQTYPYFSLDFHYHLRGGKNHGKTIHLPHLLQEACGEYQKVFLRIRPDPKQILHTYPWVQ